MFKRMILVAAAAALCCGCATMTPADCASSIEKVQNARKDLQAAQAVLAAICTTGVASKECRDEIQIAARIHAALDLAMAIAAGACPTMTIGDSPPAPAPVPAPAAKTI